jgi:diacylglycerol kinase family enzyme
VDEIDDAVRACWDDDVELVLLTTGDGGLHRFLSSFVNTYRTLRRADGSTKSLPLFATLRSGTANLMTGVLGGRGRPQRAIERLFALLEQVRQSDELPRIRQKLLAVSDGIQQRFGFMTGSGGVYNFFLEYYQGTRYNLFKFLKILSRSFMSLLSGGGYLDRLLSGVNARLNLDEQLARLSHWKVLVVSAIDARVVFFRAFRAGRDPEQVHIKAGSPSRLAIIRNLPNVLFNRAWKGRRLLDQIVRRVQFEAEREFGYTIDGELYRARTLEISAGPVVEFLRF